MWNVQLCQAERCTMWEGLYKEFWKSNLSIEKCILVIVKNKYELFLHFDTNMSSLDVFFSYIQQRFWYRMFQISHSRCFISLEGSCLCRKHTLGFGTKPLTHTFSLSLFQVLRRWLVLLLVPVSTLNKREDGSFILSPLSLICQSSLALSFFIVSVLHPSLCLLHFSWAARPVAFIIVKPLKLA